MPMITIAYDNAKVTDSETTELSHAIQTIVSSVTKIEDVFVYAQSPHIKVKIAPVEIFIQMSAYKISDKKDLLNHITLELKGWKQSTGFPHPINLTLIPMDWEVAIGI